VALAATSLLAMFTIDAPISYFVLNSRTPSIVRELFRVIEIFGNGLGVLLLALTIYVIDPKRRMALPRLLVASLGAGSLANLIKLGVERARPKSQFFAFDDRLVNFHGIWPYCDIGSEHHSFPSSHTATAVGLAVAL